MRPTTLLLGALMLTRPSHADPEGAAAGAPSLSYERYHLENGIEIILHRDSSVPLMAVDVWYHVGSGDEEPGKSGFAHLFEHMFKNSEHLGDRHHYAILREAGSVTANATTSPDRTNYYEVLPSSQLELALWIESDRMGYFLPGLGVKRFEAQRDIVRNERRQNYDNRAYGKERFAVAEALYPEGHPYRYLTIGRHEDIENATLEDVRAFFKKWYVPANATVCIAGDIDIDETKRLVEKWFGSFPPSERPPKRKVDLPPISGPRRVEVKDEFAGLRRVHYVWHAPAAFAPGEAELDVLASVLARTGTGRLYKTLVHQKQLAQAVAAYHHGMGHSGEFHVVASVMPQTDLAELETLLDAEIERVRTEPITERELRRAQNNVEASMIWQLERLTRRAERLQRYNHYLGDPGYLQEDLKRYQAVTVESVLDVARRILPKSARVEVITIPVKKK